MYYVAKSHFFGSNIKTEVEILQKIYICVNLALLLQVLCLFVQTLGRTNHLAQCLSATKQVLALPQRTSATKKEFVDVIV